MLDIATFLNYRATKHKWKFTKFFTGSEETEDIARLHIQKELDDIEACAKRDTSVETIKNCCLEWVTTHVGHTFTFRQYQLEYIVGMLDNILNHQTKINCLEAPTGSGKSWIAMVIAGVAWEYYRKTSYILVSDIGLLNQYWEDVNNYRFHEFGHMKGLANYSCDANRMVFPSSECRMHKISYEILMKPKVACSKGYPCATTCECILDRKRAIVSPITIMTYVLYLTYMNDVVPMYAGTDKVCPFEKRDIVICDEVHKMPSIVQNYCSPEFDWAVDKDFFAKLIKCCSEYGFYENPEDEEVCNLKNIQDAQFDIVMTSDKKESFEALIRYVNIQKKILECVPKIREMINKKKEIGDKLDKSDKKLLGACSWIENRSTHFTKYPSLVDKIGYDKMVVNSVYDTVKKELNKYKFTINCVYEEYLVKEFFNDKCDSEIMMSATIGDCALFRREVGAEIGLAPEDFKFYRIPSTFDFTNSPIYVLPTYRMSYAYKEQNMPYIINLINGIVARHQGQKGIIHTGSYDFSRRVLEGVDDMTKSRILCYTNSKDKEMCIDNFYFSKDKVLVGPTLVEGINLPDDECRFMIIMKVPYPNLGDKLVSAKKDVIPNWYNGETIKSVIQSLGRGIRHKNDWCITYVIDGSFCTIYNATQGNLSDDLKKRIQYVTV